MKKLLIVIAGLAIASAALAAVKPNRPMVTGRGNVEARPTKVIVTNQTAPTPDEPVKLEGIMVTGSLIKHSAKFGRKR